MKIKKTLSILLILINAVVQPLIAFEKDAYLAYLRGLLAEQAEDLPGSVSEFNKVISLDKNAVSVYRDLAYAYWQLGEKYKAFEAAQKLKELYGENVDAQLFLGSFYMTAGQGENAREAWEQALKIDPQNESAILYLAAFYSTNNNPKEAVEYWDKYIRQKPESAESYYQRGISYEKLGQREKAEKSLEQTIAIKPDSYEAYFALAQIYEKEGRISAAIKECEKYLSFVPDNATLLMYLGGLYYKEKDYASAEEVFKKADEINPGDTTIIFWLGTVAEERKDWESAIKYFEMLRTKEETPMLLARLSYYYSFEGENSKAIKYLRKAIKLDPKNPNLYYLAALAYSDLKKYEQAKENFEEALKLKPDFSDAYFHMGIMYDDQGKFDEAEPCLEKAIELDPKNTPALNYLGYSYAEKNIKLDRAEDLVGRALAIDPENPAFLDSMGWVYFRENKLPEAKKYLMQATAKLDDPTLFEHLGDIELKLGEKTDAWQAYRNALEISAKNKKIKEKLKELESNLSENDLGKAMLLRIISRYARIKSFRFQFFMKGESGSYNFHFSGNAKFLKPALWRIDVLGGIMNPEFSAVFNQGIKTNPRAFEKYIPDEVNAFFNTHGYAFDEFSQEDAKISSDGKYFVYEAKNKALKIRKKSALPEKLFVMDGVSLEFSDYTLIKTWFFPESVDFVSKYKLKGTIRISGFEVDKAIDSSMFNFQKETPK